MYTYSDIRVVHLEITTKCNARCPQCPRNLWGGPVNPSLPIVELSLDDCIRIFPPAFVQQLRQLYMCGDYGDPIMARDTLDVFDYIRGCSRTITLKMHTNGSARPAGWWEKLARTGCIVRFAIDGLADTNHLYRRGTRWATILRNVEAFIGAEGRAEWAYIVFRHNEHQVEEAHSLARDLGFTEFIVKRTKRFLDSGKGIRMARSAVHNGSGELEYYLEPPENPAYQIPLTEPWRQAGEGSLFEEYMSATPIHCRAVKEKMIYVNAQGLALPCCWLGNLYPRNVATQRPQVWTLIDTLPGGQDSLDVVKHGIEKVIEGPFFQESVPHHWQPMTEPGQRLSVCAKVCGEQSVHDLQATEKHRRSPLPIYQP